MPATYLRKHFGPNRQQRRQAAAMQRADLRERSTANKRMTRENKTTMVLAGREKIMRMAERAVQIVDHLNGRHRKPWWKF